MELYGKGNYCETKLPICSTMKFEWTIERFNQHPKILKETLTSPKLWIGDGLEFQWTIEASFNVEHDFCLCMRLSCDKSQKVRAIQSKFSIPSINNEEDYSRVFTEKFVDKKQNTNVFIAECKLRDYISPSDTLTIICEGIAFGTAVSTATPMSDVPKCRLRKNFQRLFETKKFSDVTLSAYGQEIRAHKIILAAESTVFAAMFEHDMEERKLNRVEIKDVDADVLNEILRFIYTGSTDKLKDMAFDLHAVADKYDLGRLKVLCEVEMLGNITVQNAAKILIKADLYRVDLLKKTATTFIIENLVEVMKTAGYKIIARSYPNLIADLFIKSVLNKSGDD